MPAPSRRTPKRPVSPTEAARRRGVCRRTIYNWIEAGVITGYRVGPKLIQVDLDEIERLPRRIPVGGGDAA